nr:putative ribonuclease H-like domain-containing protein [Tanacetum cinerariifolium]
EVDVEEHHRKLLLFRNKKHMSSECNNVKLAAQNVKAVCAMCKQCLNSVNHDVCLLNYVNGMNSHGRKQKTNVLINEKQKKQQPKVKKTKKVGSIERLASHKPSKPRSVLRWSPTGRIFDLKGKIIASNESESQSDCSNGDNAYEAPYVIKTFLKRITILLQSPVIIIRTDNGTEFKKQVLKEYFDSVGISHQVSSVRTPQQNTVVEQRNRTLVEASRTMLIFSRALLFLWAEAIATACFTQNHSIIHRRFNKTPYELINDKKSDISFLYVFGALCYPKNDREDIRKLGAKGDIGFSLVILLIPTPMTSTSIADTALTPTISSSQATNFPNTSQDIDELNSQQQHVQQQENQVHLQSEIDADNVSHAMFDGNTFVNPFVNPSTSVAESSSSQNVDLSNMHTFYQLYPHEFQ